ncbi:ATP-binding protein [Geodermatophilus maliterrae]|uniref:ATP-binding protein n=1 Tax=Geodermatophilus maliterrae TaxID=3162531 RepID=A0ABV3XHW6_9ACTN
MTPPQAHTGPTHTGPTPAGRRWQWRSPGVVSSVPSTRRKLRHLLDGTGLSSDEIEDLVLAASEAAINAVEHSPPSQPFFDVCVEFAGGVVTILVRDHGRWRPPVPDSYRGRGLAMMCALADTTVTPGEHGTTVAIRSRRSGS